MVERRLLVGGQVAARFDQGEDGPAPEAVQRRLAEQVLDLAPHLDVLIIADHGLGALGSTLAEVELADRGSLLADRMRAARRRVVHTSGRTSWPS